MNDSQWRARRSRLLRLLFFPTRQPKHRRQSPLNRRALPPIITVVGKAFFDIGHSLKDQTKNRRENLPGYTAWEIHR